MKSLILVYSHVKILGYNPSVDIRADTVTLAHLRMFVET